eukprot:TRINITY_DN6157_c0_g1_i3.p1 TRINITY_DN6157_c0_g1~~TRINITY_DN6157_c0_g1_i3.p1  ORF type:complete len:277 (-),score=49.50 TRINITY_DN6157_c0_g1_i3:443-1273(-)
MATLLHRSRRRLVGALPTVLEVDRYVLQELREFDSVCARLFVITVATAFLSAFTCLALGMNWMYLYTFDSDRAVQFSINWWIVPNNAIIVLGVWFCSRPIEYSKLALCPCRPPRPAAPPPPLPTQTVSFKPVLPVIDAASPHRSVSYQPLTSSTSGPSCSRTSSISQPPSPWPSQPDTPSSQTPSPALSQNHSVHSVYAVHHLHSSPKFLRIPLPTRVESATAHTSHAPHHSRTADNSPSAVLPAAPPAGRPVPLSAPKTASADMCSAQAASSRPS